MQHQAHFSPAWSQPVVDFPYRQVEPGIGYPGPSVSAMTSQGTTVGFRLNQVQKDALMGGPIGLVAGGALGAFFGEQVGFGPPLQSGIAGAAIGGFLGLAWAVYASPGGPGTASY